MKYFLIILFIVLTLGALIFYYFIREDDSDFSPWLLSPRQSAIVIETDEPMQSWEEFLNSGMGKGFSNTSLYNNTTSFFSFLDSISGTTGAVNKILSGPLLINVIPTARDQFELLYILPVSDNITQDVMSNINSYIKNNSSINQTSRRYLERNVYEITTKNKVQLAFTFFKDYLIVSKSPFLVESVIRQINNEYKGNFRDSNRKLFELPLLASDAGNIFVNYKQLSRLLKTFTGIGKSAFFDPLTKLNAGAALDLSFAEKAVILNGFSMTYDSSYLFNQFNEQQTAKPEAVNYIPRRTQFLYSYQYSNPEKLQIKAEVEKWLGKEINYLELPSLKVTEPSGILLIETRDPGTALNYFNTEAEKASKEDTVYREYFAGFPITEVTPQKWPEAFFKNAYQPFSHSFFTMINNYVVVGSSIEAIKILIEDIENENTWGKNLDVREYLNLGLEETNFNLIINPENFWTRLDDQLNDNWKNDFKTQERFLKGFLLNIIQLSRIEDKYYTSVVLPYEPRQVLTEGDRNLKNRFVTNFKYPLSSNPHIVKSHVSNQFEILVQDERRNLSLLDWEGNILWTDSLGDVISGEVFQVDYYSNDKLQYLLYGGNNIYLIDRNGDKVEDYPIAIGKHPIHWLNVVDYDNSKNYRFLVSDTQGSLYMIDKHGNLLEGWTPKVLHGKLSSRPFHVRVRAKDYIVAVQQNGVIHVLNRRGEYYPGFPLDVEGRIAGDVMLKKGTSASETSLTLVTEGGQLLELNFKGEALRRENLYRPTRESKFYLVPEIQENGFIIVREGLNRVAILDDKGNRRFEKDYLSLDPLNIQYYNFGSDREVIAVTDQEQNFTYLYNGEGDLINNQPINSMGPVAILYFSGQKRFHVIKAFDNSLTALTF